MSNPQVFRFQYNEDAVLADSVDFATPHDYWTSICALTGLPVNAAENDREVRIQFHMPHRFQASVLGSEFDLAGGEKAVRAVYHEYLKMLSSLESLNNIARRFGLQFDDVEE